MSVITVALLQPRTGRIINLADQNPDSKGDVVLHAAALFGITPLVTLPLEGARLSPMAGSFNRAHQHIKSLFIKLELDVYLLCPDYKAGLAAILEV